MKLYEMIKALRVKGRIEVRDVNGNELFTSAVTSEILNSPYSPYLFFHVTEWFPGHAPFKDADFTVYIADDFEAKERIGDCTKCEKQKSCYLGKAKVRIFCKEYEEDEQRTEKTSEEPFNQNIDCSKCLHYVDEECELSKGGFSVQKCRDYDPISEPDLIQVWMAQAEVENE